MARHGTTLIGQLVGISLLGLLFSITLRGAATLRDQLALRSARGAVREALALARDQAMAGGRAVAVRFDARDGRLVVHAADDSLHRVALASGWGVALATTRDSTAYLPSGLGAGAANLSIILRRGAVADTLTVSRLGRVR
jgi:Tfp pilus assembly protein FimT